MILIFNKCTKYATATTVLGHFCQTFKIPCVCLPFIPAPSLALGTGTLNNFFHQMENLNLNGLEQLSVYIKKLLTWVKGEFSHGDYSLYVITSEI